MKLLQLLKAPLWLAALASGAKSFVDNPIIGSRRLNQLGLHAARVSIADRMSEMRRRFLRGGVNADDAAAFHRDGYVVKENFLPAAEFDAVRKEIFETSWEAREMRQGNAITRRVPLDAAQLRISHPALTRMITDAGTIALIRYVASTAGYPIFWIQTVLGGLADGDPDPQTFLHSDTFHATAKAWFFLQDVGIDDGPFSYVRGSHRLTSSRLAWERTQSLTASRNNVKYHARGSFRVGSDDLERMELPPAKAIPVKANTLIVADTHGFHARMPSTQPTCRVEIFASIRRNPFLPWNGLDPLALPFIKERTGSLSIATLEILKRIGLAKMPWQPVGKIYVNDVPTAAAQPRKK